MQTTEFEAIGTHWKIDVYDTPTQHDVGSVVFPEIRALIEEFEKKYSRFHPDSLVTQMAHRAGAYVLPHDAKPLLDLYADVYTLTDGAVTPFIGDVLVAAGYDADYSLHGRAVTPPLAWDEAIEYSFPNITIKKPTMLDFGAAGKGYLVDLVSAHLRSRMVQSFCVDAGGDMFYQHAAGEPLSVGLEHPEHGDEVIGTTRICGQSICGSAGNRRKWGVYHHIIDPRTLRSPQHILAVWVVADSAILADALTTCLFFVSPSVLLSRYQFAYVILFEDYSVDVSPQFPGELFTA